MGSCPGIKSTANQATFYIGMVAAVGAVVCLIAAIGIQASNHSAVHHAHTYGQKAVTALKVGFGCVGIAVISTVVHNLTKGGKSEHI